MIVQRHVWVTGRVQGVGFRASTVRAASAHPGLRGWVRNLDDGRVEAVFSGDSVAVLAMVEWCRKGPSTARVTHLEVKDEAADPALGPFGVEK